MSDGKHSLISSDERSRLDMQRAELTEQYLLPKSSRPTSSARGVHHVALVCSNVEATIDFYQGLLEFPLTEMFENRDLAGSTHFFFDIGNGNSLAFFDLPGVDPAPYAEVLGGLHHLAISVEPAQWQHLKSKLDNLKMRYAHVDGSSLYITDPDQTRVELISDPLGEMYGNTIG